MDSDHLIRIEYIVKTGNKDRIDASTILEMISIIRFLRQRQTELQVRGTELVEENRKLKAILHINSWKDVEPERMFGTHISRIIRIFKNWYKGE